jgi:hypothetical protein
MSSYYKKIDIAKSIDQNRLIYNSIYGKLDMLFNRFFLPPLVFIASISLPVSFYYIALEDPTLRDTESIFLIFSILLLMLFLLLDFKIIKSVKKYHLLYRIKGKSNEINRKMVKEIIAECNWVVYEDTEEMSVLSLPMSKYLTNWGSQLVIIYDDKDILINCTSFNRAGESSFHLEEDQEETNKFKEYFKNKLVFGEKRTF